jgi:hypothetical protein
MPSQWELAQSKDWHKTKTGQDRGYNDDAGRCRVQRGDQEQVRRDDRKTEDGQHCENDGD